MTQFYAQPYDISATGFYFNTVEDYDAKHAACKNDYGDQVEEFEIQFIDGDDIDCDLFKAIGINQCNIHHFVDAVDAWEDYQKLNVIIAVGECGYDFDFDSNDPDDFDVTLYEVDTMKELAEQFVDEGLYGDIPDSLRFYIDYDAIARDLRMDYSDIRVAGVNYIYRCA